MVHGRLLRIGAIAAIAGALAQLLATVLEPELSEDLSKALRSTADSDSFAIDRLIDLIGVYLTVFGLIVVGLTIAERVGSQYVRVGQPFLVLMGALGGSAVIAGAALKEIADDWAEAVPGDRQTYRSAFAAVRELEEDLFFGAFLALGCVSVRAGRCDSDQPCAAAGPALVARQRPCFCSSAISASSSSTPRSSCCSWAS